MILFVIVDRDVGRVGPIGELGFHVPEKRGRGPALLEGGDVGERFDGRAGLAAAQRDVDLTVNRLVVKVHRADHGQDVAADWIERDQCAVGRVAIGQVGHTFAHGLLCKPLQAGVERGIDAQPLAAVERLRAISGLQCLLHVDYEMGRGGDVELRSFELVGPHLGRGCLGLCVADIAGLDHQRQHVLLAGQGQVAPAGEGVVHGRGLGQTGEEGGLRQREVGRVHAKIGLGGSLHPVGQVAIIVLVEIDLQDGVLGVSSGQFGRQDDFLDLAPGGLLDALLGGEQDVAGYLLGDGAGAGDDLPFGKDVVEGARDGDGVKADVFVELAILGSDGRLGQVGGDVGESDFGAPPAVRVHHLVERVALAVIDLAADKSGLARAQLFGRRELVGNVDVADDGGSDGQKKGQHDDDNDGKEGTYQDSAPIARSAGRPHPGAARRGCNRMGRNVAGPLRRRHSAGQSGGGRRAGGSFGSGDGRLAQRARQLAGLDVVWGERRHGPRVGGRDAPSLIPNLGPRAVGLV